MQSNSKTERAPRARTLAALPVALFISLACCAATAAQATKPISKDGLVKAVRINGLSTAELIQQIEQRGVAFEMTADAEAELRRAGARPEVVEAARSNYRAGAAAPAVNAGATKGRPAVPAGPPLSKNEIVTMLQAGSPPARVEQFVEARGVTFQSNPQVAQEIKRAGGTNSLVGAITANYRPHATPTPAPRHTPTVARGPDYDELTDQATAAYDSKDAARATQLLQQAIQLQPQSPRAYQLLGFAQLYLLNNVAEAEKNMRKAIELGGSAAFRVFHDHSNGSFRDTCSGTLFVTRTNVTFKADDGRDTFEANDPDIHEIKVNKLVGRIPNALGGSHLPGVLGGSRLPGALGGVGDIGAFHIKVKRASDSKNYNFAPLTKKKAESELIVSLVLSYGGVKS
jgi:tetratricopeptide (TPR) repeat protein